MYWFTADEHYNHARIIGYCARPFGSVTEMNTALIERFNQQVTKQDVTVHCGDFGFFKDVKSANEIIRQLHGSHVFLKGSHDRWLPSSAEYMWRKVVDGQFVVACHYALRTWERARYGAWNLYGHSHGTLPPIGKQWDVGVDCNEFTPVSFEQLRIIMKGQACLHEACHDKPLESPG